MKKLLFTLAIVATTLISCSEKKETPTPLELVQKDIDSTLYEHHRHSDTLSKYEKLVEFEEQEGDLARQKAELEYSRLHPKPEKQGLFYNGVTWMSSYHHKWHTKVKTHTDTLEGLEWKYKYLCRFKTLLTEEL